MIAVKTSQPPIHQHKGLRQFVKFCIVGFSSLAVNLAMAQVFHVLLHVQIVAAFTIAFVLSACNGFYWNRKWTFKEARG